MHNKDGRHGSGKIKFALLGLKSGQSGQSCCGAVLGFRIKISWHPLGQSASFSEIYPFRLVQRGQGGARVLGPMGRCALGSMGLWAWAYGPLGPQAHGPIHSLWAEYTSFSVCATCIRRIRQQKFYVDFFGLTLSMLSQFGLFVSR